MSRGVVRPLVGLQVTDDGIWDHDGEGQHPRYGDHFVGMRASLPHPGLQRVADGAVALYRNGNQAECGDAH